MRELNGMGLTLFRILAVIACVSLVVAGGTWVHHAQAEHPHAHDSVQMAQLPHAHIHNDEQKSAPFENLIHCGTDHVWFEVVWMARRPQDARAVGGPQQVSAVPSYLQVKEPPPRLIVSKA